MAKPLPKKYFPMHGIARINLRKVDRWAEFHAKSGLSPYFDTWGDAYKWMLERAEREVKNLERNLATAKRHLAKVQLMQEPQEGQQ